MFTEGICRVVQIGFPRGMLVSYGMGYLSGVDDFLPRSYSERCLAGISYDVRLRASVSARRHRDAGFAVLVRRPGAFMPRISVQSCRHVGKCMVSQELCSREILERFYENPTRCYIPTFEGAGEGALKRLRGIENITPAVLP